MAGVAPDIDTPLIDAAPDASPGRCQGLLEKAKFLVELLVMTIVMFYVDMVLDILSIVQMWVTHNPGLCTLNVLGILAASLLGYILIVRKIEAGVEATKESLWAGGSLYFFQMHVLYFGLQSLVTGKMHPLLYEAKFVESTVESVASASVQVYFLVWADIDMDKKRWIIASICSSFCTLAFANAGFDLYNRGIAGVRGSVMKMTSADFLKVLALRLCEIVARITSLALFQRACRPFGGVSVVALDFLVMLLLTWRQGGSLAFAVPSVFAYMNPMLEQNNAASVPCRLYVTVRMAELVGMAGVAAWWRGGALADLYWDDLYVVAGFAAGLLGTALLLPVVRRSAGHTLLAYPPDAWYARPFSHAERKLLKDIVLAGETQDPPGYQCLEEAPAEHLLEPLKSRLPPAFDFSSEEVASEVATILILTQNCPLWRAGESVKVTLVKFLCKLCDVKEMAQHGKSAMHHEVLDGGGVTVSLQLAEGPGASAELQEHTLRLVRLTMSKSWSHGQNPSSLAQRAKHLAQRLLIEEGTAADKATVAAMAQAAVVAEALGTSAEESLLAGPRSAGGVLAACAAGTLQHVPSEASVRRVLAEHGAEAFPWGDPDQEAGRVLGGLCVSELQRRRRQGEAVEVGFGEGSKEQRWALELRTPVEVIQDLLKALDAANDHDMNDNGHLVAIDLLKDLIKQCQKNGAAAFESGCLVVVQAHFSRSSDSYVKLWCVHCMRWALSSICEHFGFSARETMETTQGFSRDFFHDLKTFLESDRLLSNAKNNIWARLFLQIASMHSALHVDLLPLVPYVISQVPTDAGSSIGTLENLAMAESTQPHLRKTDGLLEVLQDAASGKFDVSGFNQSDESLSQDRIAAHFSALHAICAIDTNKCKGILTQQENLDLVLDVLDNGLPGYASIPAFEQVGPVAALAALPEAAEELHKRDVVGRLCRFCVGVGLEGPDDEKGVGVAFDALNILMAYPQFATLNWEESGGSEFRDLVKRASERPLIRSKAQVLGRHCRSAN